jgi:hypothetical protein
MRAAEYIVNVYGAAGLSKMSEDFINTQLEDVLKELKMLLEERSAISPKDALQAIRSSMSLYGSHIRELKSCEMALAEAHDLYMRLRACDIQLNNITELIDAVRARHLSLAQIAFLGAIVEYLNLGGGSRGSFVVRSSDGEQVHPHLIDPTEGTAFAIVPENICLRDFITEVEISSVDDGTFCFNNVPVRPIPARDDAFELAWAAFRNGDIYRK